MNSHHIAWVNELADLKGGCEHYVFNTVRQLRTRGVRSTLFYDPLQGPASAEMLQAFDGAFPIVDLPRQLADLAPDIIYAHRLSGMQTVQDITASGIPSIRFFHDHKQFCPREHKYTTLKHNTCSRPIGWHCYPCLGFLNRNLGWLPVRITTVASLRREHRASMPFSACVVASRYMADHLALHGFDRSKIHVLPLYSLPPAAPASPSGDANHLLFVGQLVRGKGLDVLLRALTMTRRPVRLWVAGSGRQDSMFRALAASLGLSDRVSFLGKMSQEELGEYYPRALAVVLPTRQPETFGLIGPESMSRGVPVIATAIGGITDWLEDGVTGISVPPNEPEALAEAIDKIAGDPVLRQSMGEKAKKHYDQKFRPEVHVTALLDLFNLLHPGKTP
jgi:glycosyltransferase involved in cell wall biosynthesis